MAKLIQVFVAAPSDVAAERDCVADVAAGINRNWGVERDVQFRVLDWKTDARPRMHDGGPQGPIDEDMPVESWDSGSPATPLLRRQST
jgi:hypothetical protein